MKSRKISKIKFYKEHISHPSHWHKKERWKIFFDGLALSLPLLAAFSWYLSLIFASISPVGDVYLSPAKTEPVIVFVLVFIVSYSLFLMVEYNILSKRLKKLEEK